MIERREVFKQIQQCKKEAVKLHRGMLCYAVPELRGDREIVSMAVSTDCWDERQRESCRFENVESDDAPLSSFMYLYDYVQ